MTARGLQVIGLDFRGHGRSDKPGDPALHGTVALTRDVIALLDHLGIEQAAIVGYSIGSTVALHLLHTHLDRFRAGALVATGDGIVGNPPRTFPAILPPMVEILGVARTPGGRSARGRLYRHFAETVGGSRAGVAALSGAYPPCSPPDEDATHIGWARDAWEDMRSFSTGGTYVNFLTEDEGPERIAAALGKGLPRLTEIKAGWDPQNVFRTNRNVTPA